MDWNSRRLGGNTLEVWEWISTSHLNFSEYVLVTLQGGAEHSLAAKSLQHVFHCTASICFAMLGSNTIVVVDNDLLWLIRSVLTAHNLYLQIDLTKSRAW